MTTIFEGHSDRAPRTAPDFENQKGVAANFVLMRNALR
jgi:hypothetical protein